MINMVSMTLYYANGLSALVAFYLDARYIIFRADKDD